MCLRSKDIRQERACILGNGLQVQKLKSGVFMRFWIILDFNLTRLVRCDSYVTTIWLLSAPIWLFVGCLWKRSDSGSYSKTAVSPKSIKLALLPRLHSEYWVAKTRDLRHSLWGHYTINVSSSNEASGRKQNKIRIVVKRTKGARHTVINFSTYLLFFD